VSRAFTEKNIQIASLVVIIVATLIWLFSGSDCSNTGKPCVDLLQATITGLLVGGVYALVALGIVIINKASGIFNFSHGLMMLFGGLVFYQSFNNVPSTQLSLILGVLAGGICLFFLTESAEQRPPTLEELHENRWQRLVRTVQEPRFLLILGASIAVGVIATWLLQNVNDKIIRGAIGALIASIALGLAVERFTIRPLLGQPILASIMMTLAIALLLQGATSLFWGSQPRSLSVFVEPQLEQVTLIPIGVDENGDPIYQEIRNTIPPKVLPNYKLPTADLLGKDLSLARNLVWGFGIAILCFMGFVLFFQFTNTGLAMRAVAENQTLAESVGLRVRTILAVAWAIATTMAMIAAVIQGTGPGVGLSLAVIPPLAFRAFPAVLLGGLESITGALVGGLIIGVVEMLATILIDSTTGQEFAPFAVLLVVLVIRPDGLFGQRRIDRV